VIKDRLYSTVFTPARRHRCWCGKLFMCPIPACDRHAHRRDPHYFCSPTCREAQKSEGEVGAKYYRPSASHEAFHRRGTNR